MILFRFGSYWHRGRGWESRRVLRSRSRDFNRDFRASWLGIAAVSFFVMSFEKPAAQSVDGASFRFLVVAARYNSDLVDSLLRSTVQGLAGAGVPEDSVTVLRVPGSNEVPYAIQLGFETGDFDAGIGLGVLIRGETSHYEHIAQSVSDALQMVALNQGLPVINGIVVAENREQAAARASGALDRGREFAQCALEMAALRKGRLESYEQQ